MKTHTVNGVEYLMVRAIYENSCTGCVVRDDGPCHELQKEAPDNENYYCCSTVWILNTPEAKTAHALTLLEES